MFGLNELLGMCAIALSNGEHAEGMLLYHEVRMQSAMRSLLLLYQQLQAVDFDLDLRSGARSLI